MAEYGMGDEASIKQVLDEVDRDKVRIFFRLTNPVCIDLIITPTEFTGWEYRLWRVCGNDEEGKLYLRHFSDLMMEEVVYIYVSTKYCKYKQQCKFNSEHVASAVMVQY